MKIIHEVFPNGVPRILVAEINEDDSVVRNSIRIHPVIKCPVSKRHIVLEPLPFENAHKIIPRLNKYK